MELFMNTATALAGTTTNFFHNGIIKTFQQNSFKDFLPKQFTTRQYTKIISAPRKMPALAAFTQSTFPPLDYANRALDFVVSPIKNPAGKRYAKIMISSAVMGAAIGGLFIGLPRCMDNYAKIMAGGRVISGPAMARKYALRGLASGVLIGAYIGAAAGAFIGVADALSYKFYGENKILDPIFGHLDKTAYRNP
jgi:hypothetical protein